MSESVLAAIDDFAKKYGYGNRSKAMRAIGIKTYKEIEKINYSTIKKKIAGFEGDFIKRAKTKQSTVVYIEEFKERSCLCCSKSFLSKSPFNRVCPACKAAEYYKDY